MLSIQQKLAAPTRADVQLILPFESRQKSRLLTRLATGEEVGLFLERGTLLRGGDCLLASDGRVIAVVAAAETVSVVSALDAWSLARAAYHLGNRHVSLQVAGNTLRYLHDHVLDDMVRGLGFTVTVSELPFEPEAGAYTHSGADKGHRHTLLHAPSAHHHG